MRLFLVLLLLVSSPADAADVSKEMVETREASLLPNRAVVITHATRHYNRQEDIIRSTNETLHKAHRQGRLIYALHDREKEKDSLWYVDPSLPIRASFVSIYGESDLSPDIGHSARTFEFVALGGYHSACLGYTVTELMTRFLLGPSAGSLYVNLPMKAIYTGFLFDSTGALVPERPEDEAKADSSINGLSLHSVTRGMTDHEWAAFMIESLKWAVFKKSPLVHYDVESVAFRLYRDGRLIREFEGNPFAPPGPRKKLPKRVVELRYLTDL